MYVDLFLENKNNEHWNEVDLKPKRLETLFFNEEITNDTQLHLDKEKGASQEQLKDLIRKEAMKQNEELHNEIKKLQQQLKQ